jgi:hypothetical protein
VVVPVIDGSVVVAVGCVVPIRYLVQRAAAEMKEIAVLDEREIDETETLSVGGYLKRC